MKLDKIKKTPKVYVNSGLPLKFVGYDIEDFKILGKNKAEREFNRKSFQKFKDYYDNLEEHLENGQGLIICGAKGIGKSMLMTILAKRAIDIFVQWNKEIKKHFVGQDASHHLNRLHFIQSTSLIQLAFRSTCSPTELQLAYELKYLTGLFIDDLTKIQTFKDQKEFSILDDIFRYRDLQGLTTWATSQIDISEMQKIFPSPLMDIIKSNMTEIVFLGDSQRGGKLSEENEEDC